MKEATGEVSMTVIVIVAVAIIGGIIVALGPTIKNTISAKWGNADRAACESGGGTWIEGGQTGPGHCSIDQPNQNGVPQ